MKTAIFIFTISTLILSYNCRAEGADVKSGPSSSIQETFLCKPFGKNGARIAQVSLSSHATYEDVVNKGDQQMTGRATSIEGTAGGKTIFKMPELLLTGTAANSTKGISYELHPASTSDIKEILIAAPAAGKGASGITLSNDEMYFMNCGPVSQ